MGKYFACHFYGTLFLFALSTFALADRGALNPDVTQDTIAQTICVPGYTKNVRPATSFTNGVEQLLLKRSGLDASTADDYKLDHIIPPALGGHPRKLHNLELQRWEEAKRKNRIEVKWQCLVCAGQVALADAQRETLGGCGQEVPCRRVPLGRIAGIVSHGNGAVCMRYN